ILKAVRRFCREKFEFSEFVVCTNLQEVSPDAWQFFSSVDTHISTSLDGSFDIHQKQRTKDISTTKQFRKNLLHAIDGKEFGRLSALPTIDPNDPPDPHLLITTFADLGLNSIFLRPINFQGFARKKFQFSDAHQLWAKYYKNFIGALIEYNESSDVIIEEYYLTHVLRRILQGGHNNHVDLRNPNWLGQDYLVIDYNGVLYPTDEARMVSRLGQVDLSIGNIKYGLDPQKLAVLNGEASNFFDPECRNCVYQPYCGVDNIDDISRYGRIDVPKHFTDHCQKHMSLFDLAFELIYSPDTNIQKSLAAWLDVPKFSPQLAPEIK
ncbi:MAG: His-Xaa-Ser system radical SAM maturase HxsB, partial [Paracoccaceae bacterium]